MMVEWIMWLLALMTLLPETEEANGNLRETREYPPLEQMWE